MDKPISITVSAYEERGGESKPFLQGMLNRLAFGKQRYEKKKASDSRPTQDMIDSAVLSAQVANYYDIRERLIDAANYCYLAYRRMEDTGTLDGDSPGHVDSGIIVDARGRFEHFNGKPLELVLDSMKDRLY